MNILEDQLSDLTNLVDSPIGLAQGTPLDMTSNAPRHESSAESPAPDSNKRKSDDDHGQPQNASQPTHTRAKRNRYISIACNECKRRKIKCNGNTPCQRCGNLKLECQYAPNCCSNGFKDSDDFKRMNNQISSLQEQVDNLYASMNALRYKTDSMSFLRDETVSADSPAISATYRPSSKQQRFQGPTSTGYSLDVASSTLQNMGYPGLGDVAEEGTNTNGATPMTSPSPRLSVATAHPHAHPSRDPIWNLNKDEVIRLCRIYEEEMGIMHPVVDIDKIIIHTNNLYNWIDAASRNGLAGSASKVRPGETSRLRDGRSLLVKMICACSLVVEGNGQSELGVQLFESVREHVDAILHAGSVELKNLPLVVTVAMYHFHCDREGLAWRLIGQVARMCTEIGIHRKDSLLKTIPDEEERAHAIKVFWSVYVLDRRWSFGTGMPFALQDADIDPALPEPADLPIPYLNVMIGYSRVGSKVWRSVAAFGGEPLKSEDIGYLDYQILQWQARIPPSLQLPPAGSPAPASRAMHRLQILLYLRQNQMRIYIYRPCLHSQTSIAENIRFSHTVVELAKDTIRALTHLNRTTDIYQKGQVCFNYFLLSALAVLFLASCHAPQMFSNVCREEFFMALDLVKGFSSDSFVSKRLWKTIRGLKEIGPRVGLLSSNPPDERNLGVGQQQQQQQQQLGDEDPHSSAALAMAGLAGHEISGLGGFGNDTSATQANGTANMGVGETPMNGFQMSTEMTNLFEAALVMAGNGGANAGTAQTGGFVGLHDGVGEGLGTNLFGGDDELYRQMRDLF